MTVNINLLPKRERETSSSAVLLVIFLIILFGISGWMYYKIQNINKETEAAEKQLLVAKVQSEQRGNMGNADKAQQSAKQLAQSIQKLENEQTNIALLLQKITSFLPARGVFQTFSYKEPGTIVLEIRFDEKKDAAYFYSRLQKEKWVEQASLSSLKAIEISDEQGNQAGMPRYIAHYEIIIKQDKVKALEKEGDS
jgi:type IV pilus assembly protein PilN